MTGPTTSDERRGRRRRSLLPTIGLGLVVLGCGPVGPGTPTCGELEVVHRGSDLEIMLARASGEATPLNAAELLQLQAVPAADWGVCVEELPAGWSTGLLAAERGRAELSLAAPSLGLPFATATVTERCEVPEDAQSVTSVEDGPPRFVQVHEVTTGIGVAVVPVAARHHDAALTLTATLTEREVRGTPLRVTLAASPEDVTVRIDRALEADSSVVVVDDDYLRRGELELRTTDRDGTVLAPLGRILAELGDGADPQVYRATWWHPSPRSCVTYSIAARGPGSLEVPEQLEEALGFLPLAELRGHLEDAGYELGPIS
ncbi:MAG: hypothetical protein EA340_08155 [Nitriliruptor sp.]|nr:MAG: hypothetical protein EA340_08155 [Nitriliruptor sp.]TVR24104.1 MAG: hypothetical protein EA387_06000 [Nitriliruptor sp.]